MFARNTLLMFCMTLSLAACLSPVQAPTITNFVLDAKPEAMTKRGQHPISLYVAPIMANPLYNTKEIAYTAKSHQINYYVKNEWAATPPKMLVTLVMLALQKTNYFHAVSTIPGLNKYDYTLALEIVELKQHFYSENRYSVMHVTLNAELINNRDNSIVASKQYAMTEPAEPSPYGGVTAANRAFSKILTQLSEFCVKHAR